MRRMWTGNLRIKIGALVAALIVTTGFYTAIAANPLADSDNADTAASVQSGAGSDSGRRAAAPQRRRMSRGS